jgi:hypothetical protein
MQAHDLDAPNLDTVREPRGRSRLFLEDDPPMNVEGDAFMSVRPEGRFRASGVFLFLFVVVLVTGGALAWWYYRDQATDMIRAWVLPSTTTSKPTTVKPEDFAEFQQQIKSVADDLAAVKHTLEQFVANQDRITRKQEEIARKQEQMSQAVAALPTQDNTQKISAPPPAHKPAPALLPNPAQRPAHVSTQDSPKPIQVAPPQSLLPPKQ